MSPLPSLSPVLDSLVSSPPVAHHSHVPNICLSLSCRASNFMLIKFCQNIEMLSLEILPGLGGIWWEREEIFIIRRAGSVLAERSNGRQTEWFIILAPSVINTQYEYQTQLDLLCSLHYRLSLLSRPANNNCVIQASSSSIPVCIKTRVSHSRSQSSGKWPAAKVSGGDQERWFCSSIWLF